ncbi:AAA family ATPase [Kroppenstedtia pulmonis]|uniref:AAA family ATPase n=2 Tax=Kroppenstedtia pulmonis TaxID=1380685 RepID=A0A7D3XTF8_9BACL|nr:AAA family ATPase [Kroppenstedtia pulmonis]
MVGIPQDLEFHAEGNVCIHTKMVARCLTNLKEWREKSETERAILFAAALLHDAGKVVCTKKDSDGRISSRGHARIGASLSRRYLWGMKSVPSIHIREAIVSLVRFHGLPLWFWERDEPEREIFAASQAVPLEWVALLVEADVRGRICRDKKELLERVDWFREYCRELQCYHGPRKFPNVHTRFRYFQEIQRDPGYQAYEDHSFEVVLMSGLPGVGKDTWIRQHVQEWPVISLDQIRKEAGISPNDSQGQVIQEAKEQARKWMRQQRSFVWNATNITRHLRRPLIRLFASYGARIRIVYLDASPGTVISRNRRRKDPVPEEVIRKLVRKLEVPDSTEAHQVDWVDCE